MNTSLPTHLFACFASVESTLVFEVPIAGDIVYECVGSQFHSSTLIMLIKVLI